MILSLIKSTLRNAGALALTAAILAVAVAPAVGASTWTVDSAHTEVNFSVKHFFTPVSGSFQEFEVDLVYDSDKPEKSRVTARIKVASVNTGNEQRDGHLRTADWFEADKYPYMTFESSSVRAVGDNSLVAKGTLEIKGLKKQIELPITLLGRKEIPENMQAMLGGAKEVTSFKAATAVDRGDFGVGVGNFAATMVVGGEVTIEILLEAHRK